MSIAVVAGAIATYPLGGVAWDYGQYAVGLEKLGFEVYYLEDTGLWMYDAHTQDRTEDCSYGLNFLRASLQRLSPSLADRWHFRAADDRTYGLDASSLRDIVLEADLFLNISGMCLLRDEYMRCRRKALIDTDPGWNHFVGYPRADMARLPPGVNRFRAHDVFYTYAERLGRTGCRLRDFEIQWHPTRPPVVVDAWAKGDKGAVWTTVLSWNAYETPIAHDGELYGSKDMQFPAVEDLPLATGVPCQIASTDIPPLHREHLRRRGWSVIDSVHLSATAEAYRQYIQNSRGEFSVAKNVYVATKSGWFSCRSVCYLASSRPVILEDTGFSEIIATGTGLLTFTNLKEACQAITKVEEGYDEHCRAAREVAEGYFDSDVVLGEMLDRAGVGGV